MTLHSFCENFQKSLLQISNTNSEFVDQCDAVLNEIDNILNQNTINILVKMSVLTLLFEGCYQFFSDKTLIKEKLSQIRIKRWANHYGTPTITFLLTYQNEINKICNNLNKASIEQISWDDSEKYLFIADEINQVLVNPAIPTKPTSFETTGELLKTHNPFGGYTTTPSDPISEAFIEYTNTIRLGNILEIGAAFGAASLKIIRDGLRVFCNDIEVNNLAVIGERYIKKTGSKTNLATGDNDQLILLPASFPEELYGLPDHYFDAILISRVLHFFPGKVIEKSLSLIFKYLKPGGKVFVVCETPYLKNWQKFIPEFNKKSSEGLKWPGEITNPAEFETSGRAKSLPPFVNWISKEILERSLLESQFHINQLSYINRKNLFPADLVLDGRESIGAVAEKPMDLTG